MKLQNHTWGWDDFAYLKKMQIWKCSKLQLQLCWDNIAGKNANVKITCKLQLQLCWDYFADLEKIANLEMIKIATANLQPCQDVYADLGT